ncbi:MAG TPA: class I adenylate-forming enzyme family protein [Stellaceae bacterium]|jgi:acyl-CoA synthetase|nr:class I adenylate-forming enzyme family protein [Stellaceae bacterium]
MSGPLLTLLNASMISAYTVAGCWGDETLYCIAARHARGCSERWAVRDRYRRLTYAALVDAADRLAGYLAAQGLRAGERVAVWLPSGVETAIALLACSRNGYVCSPSLHRTHTVGQVAALVDRMRAAALIARPAYGADADRRDIFALLADCEYLRWMGRVGAPNAPPFDDLPGEHKEVPPSRDPNQIMYLPFTSGTTGLPKGVLHSDNTLLASARMMVRDWALEGAVLYTLSPLSHNLGLGALVTALAGGGELVVHDLPRGESLVDRLEDTAAAFLFGVPTHAIDLLAEMRARGLRRLRAVRGFRISGAAAPAQLVADLIDHGVTPQSGYGMTETCSHQYTRPDDPPQRIIETSGCACDGYELRIWRQDNADIEAAPGEIGEIGGRGASLMLGYFDDQTATETAFNAGGWFMTGDLGRLDESGYLRVTGRKKDVIIRGGRNIHPAPIEALASEHPAVRQAAAFPLADPRLGERVCLAVVPGTGTTLDPATLLAHLKEGGVPTADLPEFILPLSEMPLTASGKIVKRELIQWVEEGRVRPEPVRLTHPAPMEA